LIKVFLHFVVGQETMDRRDNLEAMFGQEDAVSTLKFAY
jgi:hypothetical protein